MLQFHLRRNLLAVVFLAAAYSKANEDKYYLNVGTVLFTDADNNRKCWSNENLALLTSRMVLEDLLPARKALSVRDDAFVTDIIEYFRLILEVVKKYTFGKSKHIMLLALTDTLGGYLNHLVLPLAKYAYYAGSIEYTSMEKLYQLFDELKTFLRTNGHGWSKPIKPEGTVIRADRITLQTPITDPDPCSGLIFTEHPGHNSEEDLEDEQRRRHASCFITIPMPFLDSKRHPTSIAVPFRQFPLRSIEAKASAYILVKFYIASTKCMLARNNEPKEAQKFQSDLYRWINNHVMPLLSDEKFYAAFGGVYRVTETLRNSGVGEGGKDIGTYNIMPEIEEVKRPTNDLKGAVIGGPAAATFEGEKKRDKSGMVVMALLTTILIWFLLGSMFICYRIRASRRKPDFECEPDCPGPTKKSSSGSSSKSSQSRKSKDSYQRLSKNPLGSKQSKKTLYVDERQQNFNKNTPLNIDDRQKRKKTPLKVDDRILYQENFTATVSYTNTESESDENSSKTATIIDIYETEQATPRQQRAADHPQPKRRYRVTQSVGTGPAVKTRGSPDDSHLSLKSAEAGGWNKKSSVFWRKGDKDTDLRRRKESGVKQLSYQDVNTDIAKKRRKESVANYSPTDTESRACSRSCVASKPASNDSTEGTNSHGDSVTKEDSKKGSPESNDSAADEDTYEMSERTTLKSTDRELFEDVKLNRNYPATYACHTSMTGCLRMASSSEGYTSGGVTHPLVFGYEFHTSSSESSPRDETDGDQDCGGEQMSK